VAREVVLCVFDHLGLRLGSATPENLGDVVRGLVLDLDVVLGELRDR